MKIFISLIDRLRNKAVKKRFTEIFRSNAFLGRESRSGEGSGLLQTSIIRQELPALLNNIGARTLLDAPCGDLFWISKMELNIENYIGIDIVHELIVENSRLHGDRRHLFFEKNIIDDELPSADVILCRDCLVHLTYAQCFKVINNFKKSGSTYLLTTTFVDRETNGDLATGLWRPLNLERQPFLFPKPLTVINENCTEDNGDYSDKSLGLWLLNDIPALQ